FHRDDTPGRQAAEAGGGVTPLAAPPGGRGAPLGCPAVVAAPGRALSASHADPPAAETENPRSVADLAAGADGGAARPLYRGRPALDRSVDPGVPHPAG